MSGADRNCSNVRVSPLRARAAGVEVVLQRCEIADRCIQPDVEVLSRRIGNRNAEVGRIARDIPVAERFVPLPVSHSRALFTTCDCSRSGVSSHARRNSTHFGSESLKKKWSDVLQHRLRAGKRRVRIDEIGGRIDDAAHLAGVGVLILRMAVGTFALDVAVRQEHALDGIVKLLDRLDVDEPGLFQSLIDILRKLGVLR